jgi:hypothetical protein
VRICCANFNEHLVMLLLALSTDYFSTLNAPYFSVMVQLSALIICQANQRITSKVTFEVNGELSTHVFAILSYDGQLSALNSPCTTDQINGSYILKVTCPALPLIYIVGGSRSVDHSKKATLPRRERKCCLNLLKIMR